MVIKSPHRTKTQQKVAASFMDNTDLVTDWELVEQKMQKMIDEHDDNHTETGWHVESKKKCYSWKWKWS